MMPRTKDEIAELTKDLVRDYQAGMSVRRLGNKYDMAPSYVGKLIKAAGVQMRPSSDKTTYRHFGQVNGMPHEARREYLERLRNRP